MGSKRHSCGCSDCAEQRELRAEIRRGGIDDGWEEPRHRKVSSKKKKRPMPCPENDGNGHVYVWTPENVWWGVPDADGWYTDWRGRKYRYEYQICCGCLHRGPKGFRRVYK